MVIKPSKHITLEQRNKQYGIYIYFKKRYLFPYNFETFLIREVRLPFLFFRNKTSKSTIYK